MEWHKPGAPHAIVGVANLATRWRMELSGTLNGDSSRLLPLGFPRGEAAERSEADEGWRALKISTAVR